MRRARPAGLALLFALGRVAAAAGSGGPEPFAGAWILVPPGDARILALAGAASEALSPNAPGLLLDVAPEAFADATAEESARLLVAAARKAGWRAGLAVDLPDTEVPREPREAEVTTPDSLYPGLGRLLSAAAGADLFVLGFPTLEEEDLPARRFALRKIAAAVRASNPTARIAFAFRRTAGPGLFPPVTRELLRDDVAAYVDMVGLRALATAPSPEELRNAADALGITAPILLVASARRDAAALLDLAARFAPGRVPAVAAPVEGPGAGDGLLLRFGRLLDGDFGADARPARAATDAGRELPAYRFVSGADLGGIVLVPGIGEDESAYRGPVLLTLDAPTYSAFEVAELATGRTGRFEVPRGGTAPTLTFSTARGPVAITLSVREASPAEAPRARVEATAPRGITAEEILARHQVWRAARDARWKRFSAWNTTSYRIRLSTVTDSGVLTMAGAFFYEPGQGYDWVWEEAYFNGVKWPGRTVPKLPLLQPEKVSELPLELTFGDAYRYRIVGEDEVRGISCWRISFAPVAEAGSKPIYEGEVFISRNDYSAIRVRARQTNPKGDVQAVDETTDFEEVPAADGGPPMRFPLHVTGQTIFRTFSRTTVIERETNLTQVVLDPPDFEERKRAAYASDEAMVRDTDAGIRYLDKTKDGGRVPAEGVKNKQLFGLAGVYYDQAYGSPLPLLGVYYVNLDAGKSGEQTQILFGGVVLAGSWNKVGLFGTKLEGDVDVFGVAVRATDTPWADGVKQTSEEVKTRRFGFNFNLAYPIFPRTKLTATLGIDHNDYGPATDTAPDFVVPSDHWLGRFELRLTWDLAGYAFTGQYAWNRRSTWAPWGTPGNPDYDPSKADFRTWSATLGKNFFLRSFQQIQLSAAGVGTQNADRFSKITFGYYGDNPIIGFSSGTLRAEKAAIFRASYGFMVSSAFRLVCEYDHAFVWDAASGFSGASFGGAGIKGLIPGPWSTLIQLTAGTPVVGRDRGQTGFLVNLAILKIF